MADWFHDFTNPIHPIINSSVRFDPYVNLINETIYRYDMYEEQNDNNNILSQSPLKAYNT